MGVLASKDRADVTGFWNFTSTYAEFYHRRWDLNRKLWGGLIGPKKTGQHVNQTAGDQTEFKAAQVWDKSN